LDYLSMHSKWAANFKKATHIYYFYLLATKFNYAIIRI